MKTISPVSIHHDLKTSAHQASLLQPDYPNINLTYRSDENMQFSLFSGYCYNF